jgi:hypothetical protein
VANGQSGLSLLVEPPQNVDGVIRHAVQVVLDRPGPHDDNVGAGNDNGGGVPEDGSVDCADGASQGNNGGPDGAGGAGNGAGGGASNGGGGIVPDHAQQTALISADITIGDHSLNASADVLQHGGDAHHAAVAAVEVDVGPDIDIAASLAHVELVDVHIGLDFGHDTCQV